MLGLPLAIAIIGGEPARFAPLADLYRDAGRRAGFAPDALAVGINGHGFLADTREAAAERVLSALRRGDEPHRPRARLAAAHARPVRSGRAARAAI